MTRAAIVPLVRRFAVTMVVLFAPGWPAASVPYAFAGEPARAGNHPATAPAGPYENAGRVTGGLPWNHRSFTGEARGLVTVESRAARVWDARTLMPSTGWLRHEGMSACRLLADGKTLFTAGGAEVRYWDVTTSANRRFGTPDGDKLDFADASPNGKRFVTIVKRHGNLVVVWEVGTGRPTVVLPHAGGVMSAEFNATGTWVLTQEVGTDTPFHVWTADTGREVGPPVASDFDQALRTTPCQAQFDPSGPRLLVPQVYGYKLVDPVAGRVLADVRWPGHLRTSDVRFAAVGAQVVATTLAGIDHGPTLVVDAPTGKLIRDFGSDVFRCEIDPIGRRAICFSRTDGEMPSLRDVATGGLLQTLEAPGARVPDVGCFSWDGSLIMVSSDGGTTTVWRLRPPRASTRP